MSNYWSSTTDAFSADAFSAGLAWTVSLSFGSVENCNKTSKLYVWLVRSGQ